MLIFSSSLCWPPSFVAAQVDVGNLDSILLKSTTSLVLFEQGRMLYQMYLQNQPFADSKYQTIHQMFFLSLYWTLCGICISCRDGRGDVGMLDTGSWDKELSSLFWPSPSGFCLSDYHVGTPVLAFLALWLIFLDLAALSSAKRSLNLVLTDLIVILGNQLLSKFSLFQLIDLVGIIFGNLGFLQMFKKSKYIFLCWKAQCQLRVFQ